MPTLPRAIEAGHPQRPEPIAERSATSLATPPATPSAAPGPQSPADRDWGLAPSERRGSALGKVAFAAAALAVAAGGYFGYRHFLAPRAEPTVAASDEDEADSVEAREDGIPAMRDPFGEDDETPPLASRGAKARPVMARANTRGLNDQTDSSEDEVEEVDGDDWNQELSELQTAPRLTPPPVSRAGRPRLPESTTRQILDADPDEQEEPDEELEADDRRLQFGNRRSASGPSISTVEAQEELEEPEEFDDFEPVDELQPRASSQTVIVRSAATPTDDDGWSVVEDEESLQPKSTKASADADDDTGSVIKPRGTSSLRPENRARPRSAAPAAGARNRPVGEAAPAAIGARSETYTVAPGDNFWTISKKQYGTSRYFAALARHNQEKVSDPTRLRPGMEVATPPAAALEQSFPELIEKSGAPVSAARARAAGGAQPAFDKPNFGAAPTEHEDKPAATAGFYYSDNGPMYRVGGDDTLTSIAHKHLGKASRWVEIYNQNRDSLKDSEKLTVGTVLKLPPDAARVGWIDSEIKRRR